MKCTQLSSIDTQVDWIVCLLLSNASFNLIKWPNAVDTNDQIIAITSAGNKYISPPSLKKKVLDYPPFLLLLLLFLLRKIRSFFLVLFSEHSLLLLLLESILLYNFFTIHIIIYLLKADSFLQLYHFTSTFFQTFYYIEFHLWYFRNHFWGCGTITLYHSNFSVQFSYIFRHCVRSINRFLPRVNPVSLFVTIIINASKSK